MKVTLTTNLGLIDAKRLGIGAAMEGDTIDADDPSAGELIKRGWAIPATAKTTPATADIKAVPPTGDLKSAPKGAPTSDKGQA